MYFSLAGIHIALSSRLLSSLGFKRQGKCTTPSSTATPPSHAITSHSDCRPWILIRLQEPRYPAFGSSHSQQLRDAFQSNDDKMDFTVDGVDATSVRSVGLLVSKTERVTDVSFTVDDGTGRIDCNSWMNDSMDVKEMEGVSEGMYVRVHGHLKAFLGEKHLVSFCIRPVTDFDEIANHFVECMYVHSYNTKSRKQPVTVPTPSQIPRGYQTAPQNSYGKQSDTDHLTGVTKSIIDYLQRPLVLDSENGASLNEIGSIWGFPCSKSGRHHRF